MRIYTNGYRNKVIDNGVFFMKLDRNGYNKIVCPLCEGDLRESRQVAYPNGEVYYEFDCTECSFSGRIRKGNLYD
jgi:hypothetical protein